MKLEELCERWGCTEATVFAHVRGGRLAYIDISPGGIDWSKRGPKQIAFTLAQVEDFERDRARGFHAPKAEDAAPPPAGAWTGPSRLGGGKRRKGAKA